MGKFRGFLETQLKIRRDDFSHMGIEDRLKQGRDIGEKFIKDELLKHGVNIVTVGQQQNQDKYLKIDGYLNGQPSEPVQLKLRKTSRGGDDIAYELVLDYDPWTPVMEQLKNPRNQGRDYKGATVKHYFVLNQGETEIYHVPAASLKQAALGAVQEAQMDVVDKDHPFRSSMGVELRATTDNSTGISKLMAFIPAERVAKERYVIGQGQIKPTAGANVMSKKDFNVSAAQDRLKQLQAKQQLANKLRKQGYRGTDDQVIAQSGQTQVA